MDSAFGHPLDDVFNGVDRFKRHQQPILPETGSWKKGSQAANERF
jgi:hypothetical protein